MINHHTTIQKLVLDNHRVISWNTLYSGVHWATRKRLVDEIHQLIFHEALLQGIEPCKGKADLSLVAYQKRPIDSDNICNKIYIDGLKIAGYLKDDTTKFLGWSKSLSVKDKKDQLIITIESGFL